MASPGTFHSVDTIVSDLRNQLYKRGGATGIRTLGLCFTLNDRDHSGSLDVDEFEQVLQRCSIFLKKHEITALFRSFDRNGDKRIEYREFLRGVQGPMSERRLALIHKAFDKLDADGSGVLTVDDIAKRYNTSKHPEVVTGKKTQQQVFSEFLAGFSDDGGVNAHPSGDNVTFDDFASYYTDISASIPDNDDLFALMMCNCWGITEAAPTPLASADFSKYTAMIKEKIYQKCKGRNEKEHLRLAFKFFDLDNSGTVAYAEFLYALEKFGVVLDEKSSRGLFASMDTTNSGRLSYDEFAAALYDSTHVYPAAAAGDQKGATGKPGTPSKLAATGTAAAGGAVSPKQRQFAATGKNGFADTKSPATNGFGKAPASPSPQQQKQQQQQQQQQKFLAAIKSSPPAATAAGTSASASATSKAPAAAAAAAPRPTVVFVLGGPGCGKGTQCTRLANEFAGQIVHLSAGDLLRAEQQTAGSPYAALIDATIKAGKLVPGDVTISLIKQAMETAMGNGSGTVFLIDGFPRNEENLNGWNKLVGDSANVAFVLFLDCPQEVMTKRLMGRAATSGAAVRADDNASAIEKRFVGFQSDTVPIVKRFAAVGKVRVINALPAPDVVYKSVRAQLADLVGGN